MDRRGEGIRLGNLGLAYDSLSQYEKELWCRSKALVISQDRQGERNRLGNLGLAFYRLR